jgi:hypothetical protein
VAEFLGEEEKTLIDFIIDKVEQHSPPSAIAEELQDVLEKDAEMFTIKMWRVLLFELIQARPSVRVVVPWVLCVQGGQAAVIARRIDRIAQPSTLLLLLDHQHVYWPAKRHRRDP